MKDIHYGLIPSSLVEFWKEESDPLYELTIEDELNCNFANNSAIRVLEALGYEAQQDELGDIILFKSPYYSHGKLSKKHIQGVVHMSVYNATTNDPKCYCFGPEFYDRYRIPHDIYDVTTGELIHKNKWIKAN